MAAATPASEFLSEREHLDKLLADVRAGHSAALLLPREAGSGKTALLRYAARQAFGFRVAAIAGVEARDGAADDEVPSSSGDSGCAYARLLMLGASITRHLVFAHRR